MERDELNKLAALWQKKFKKRYQNSEQVMAIIEPAWIKDPEVTVGYLFLLASYDVEGGKPHVSAEVDSGKLVNVKHPRSRRGFKPFRVG